MKANNNMRQAMLTICLWVLKIKLMKKQVALALMIAGLLGACSKDNSVCIEEVAGSSRSEAYLKLYVEGYKFMVKIELQELFSQLN